MKKLTQIQFIERIKAIHGNKYDYSKTKYIDTRSIVCVTCRKHGDFWIPAGSLLRGSGCKECGYLGNRKLIFGVGIYDGNEHDFGKAYRTWRGMLERCYSNNRSERNKTYSDCSVCNEWRLYSNFKKWFDKNYIEGNYLDKDLLVPGNREYGPDTCCFIPCSLNNLFKRNQSRGHSIGVIKTKSGKFNAYFSSCGNRVYRGPYETEEDAHKQYLVMRSERIKSLAKEWLDAGRIKQNVFISLMNY